MSPAVVPTLPLPAPLLTLLKLSPCSYSAFHCQPQAPTSSTTKSSARSLVPTPGPKRPRDSRGVGLPRYSFLLSCLCCSFCWGILSVRFNTGGPRAMLHCFCFDSFHMQRSLQVTRVIGVTRCYGHHDRWLSPRLAAYTATCTPAFPPHDPPNSPPSHSMDPI